MERTDAEVEELDVIEEGPEFIIIQRFPETLKIEEGHRNPRPEFFIRLKQNENRVVVSWGEKSK